MKKSELKQVIREEIKRVLKENLEPINNKYTINDDGFYYIDKQKAYDYLSQYDDEFVDAMQFINDDEGWGEFEQYIEDLNLMSDEELEDSMRQEMSFYYYSNGDSI
jgi:predicted alpha/beta hydrolase family esterase